VPFHLLKDVPDLSVGDPGAGNLLVEGDNLLALKALLPYYGGQVKCIYIDPPYNTGNEGWIYNDNVNSPEMREWLGRTVGKEADDLTRHDKWLCMMYPRLCLLREMLREDGAIFVSIDDNEVQSLRFLMDEVFGRENFVATVIWQKNFSTKNTARHFSESHDFVVVYAMRASVWRPLLLVRSAVHDARYKNPDNDARGAWTSSDLSARNYYSLGTYPVRCPSGRIIERPPAGRYWTISEENFKRLDSENRIWWGKQGNNMPRLKRFLTDVQAGVVPDTIWPYTEVGHTQEAKKELLAACDFADSQSVFITPKPTRLIRRILELATKPGDIILDSFAGSGTTGHAVMQMNKEDGGNRRFIMVEMDPNICRNVTAERVKRVSEGYTNGGGKAVGGLGSGFRFAVLGDALFDERGNIRNTVRFGDLARHVYFVETGEPLGARASRPHSPLLGIHNGKGIYLLYNGILKDKSPDGGNVLTTPVLSFLPKHAGPKVIYGTACRLGADRLRREGIVFKQLPYKLKVDAR
ncbi:MAG TPA: site-specific DNA-methyltransferase, partial [Verrucomicrobia bacterium]|nr:site-specific DNA-methyltransferase [Verrucomicrobiota bacterium]